MSRRVLVVEDEESILASLEFLMRQSGYDTRVARDGDAAVACLPEFRPDLVILDLMLPGRSGVEVCRFIRDASDLAHTRVLILTAKGGAPDEAAASAADAYVSKPFSTRELVARARSLLEQAPP
jgi:two-component system, OmpR family, alkaline phosphatase synthesis response regulator PhoP